MQIAYDDMPRKDFIIGTFYGGTIRGVRWFSKMFYKYHNEFLAKGYFVGKDQLLYNFLAVTHPEKFLIVCSCNQPNLVGCGDPWFYFQIWYGKSQRESAKTTRKIGESEGGENDDECQRASLFNLTTFLGV